MTAGTKKTLIVVCASLSVIVVGWVMLVGAVLAWSGVATVQVVEKGKAGISVPVPMAVVEAAAISGDLLFDIEDQIKAEVELGEWGPFVNEVLGALDDCPDMVLVEVIDGSDQVRVQKNGGSLVIEVHDSDIDLKVSVPTRSIRRTVARLVT
jgi:hypothetical protein